MSKLPRISGRELIKVLEKIGFSPTRTRGSHVILKDANGRMVVVPLDNEIGPGLLNAILAEVGLTRQQFLSLI